MTSEPHNGATPVSLQLFLANASQFSDKLSPADSHWLSRRKIYKLTPTEKPIGHWHSTEFEV